MEYNCLRMSQDDEKTDAYNAAYRDALLKRYHGGNTNGNNHDNSYYNEFKQTLNNNSSQIGNMDSSSDLDYSDSNYTDRADKSFIIHDSDSEEKMEEQLDEEMLEEDSEDDAKDYLIDDLLDSKSKTQLKDTQYANDNDDDDDEEEEYVPGSDDYDSEFDGDNDYTEYDISYNEPKFQWFRFMIVIIIIMIIIPLFPNIIKLGNGFNNSLSTSSSFNSQSDITATFGTLQKQINHLYNELSIRDEKQKDEFDTKIKIIISQFEKNIKKLIPKKLLSFEDEITRLNQRLDDINEKIELNIKQLKSNPIDITKMDELKNSLMNNIDLSLLRNTTSNEDNIVRFKEYVSSFIIALFQEVNGNAHNDYDSLRNDIHQYVDEITTDKIRTIDNTDIINELKRNIEEQKVEIWHEIKEYIQSTNYQTLESQSIDQNISTNFLRKLILQIYNSNRYQWENDLDFATIVQGSTIIPSLTSSTYTKGNGLNPISLLSDSAYYSPSSYWQCSINSDNPCQLGIKFNRAIYLTKINYIHGRLINNLHIMNSAPHMISIYIMLKNDKLRNIFIKEAIKNGMGILYSKDNRFIKIGILSYDLEDLRIKQQFELPLWYINLKPLVSGIVFQIENNYGNNEYVSLKKFIVNGIIETDLNIIKTGKFPIDFRNGDFIPQFNSEDLTDDSNIDNNPEIRSNMEIRHGNVASFGEDQPV